MNSNLVLKKKGMSGVLVWVSFAAVGVGVVVVGCELIVG